MKISTSYSVRFPFDKSRNAVLETTVAIYREVVDYFVRIFLAKWETDFSSLSQKERLTLMEHFTHATKDNPEPEFAFDKSFYKYPSNYRRAAINEAAGKVSSYLSNVARWEKNGKKGKKPGYPRAGYTYPALYKEVYNRDSLYIAKVKVFTRSTWDWIEIPLRKSDADYIEKYCADRCAKAPSLRKRGKIWSLDFPFEEEVSLRDKKVFEQTILAVDLGINSACTCCVMLADGTIIGRKFLHLPVEEDSLRHALNKIKKAQQAGAKHMPRLWAKAVGINDHIATKTARYIMDVALEYDVDVIVFEHLDIQGKKRGKHKQRLHLWKANYVQAMVADKAHRMGIRISHVNAWNTSRLSFKGDGKVLRGRDTDLPSYSLCILPDGGVYNCDLNASYNIGARYFIREILKSLPEMARLDIEANVPRCTKRSTCTLSTLIRLNAVLVALVA